MWHEFTDWDIDHFFSSVCLITSPSSRRRPHSSSSQAEESALWRLLNNSFSAPQYNKTDGEGCQELPGSLAASIREGQIEVLQPVVQVKKLLGFRVAVASFANAFWSKTYNNSRGVNSTDFPSDCSGCHGCLQTAWESWIGSDQQTHFDGLPQ